MSNIKKLGIIGAGDLGKLIAHHALSGNEFSKVLFFDDYRKQHEIVDNNLVYGTINDVNQAYEKKEITHLIIAIGYKHLEFRKSMFERFKDVIPFASMIHPSVIIDKTCKVGAGVVILPGCVIDMNVEIKDNVFLNTACVIAHDSLIMSHSFFSPAVIIAGFVKIGQCCNLGISTVVIDNIIINQSVQTGGGTLVISNILEKGLYVGSPARFIR